MKIVLDKDKEQEQSSEPTQEQQQEEPASLPVKASAASAGAKPSSTVIAAGIATVVIVCVVAGIIFVPKMKANAPAQPDTAQNTSAPAAKSSLTLTPGLTFDELDATAKATMDADAYEAFIAAYESSELMSEYSMFNGIEELDNASKIMYLPAGSEALDTLTAENAKDVMRSLYDETEQAFEAYDSGFNPAGFMYALQKASRIEREGLGEDQKTMFSAVLDNNRAYEQDIVMCVVSKHDLDAANNPSSKMYCGYYEDADGNTVFVTTDELAKYIQYNSDVVKPDGTIDGAILMEIEKSMKEYSSASQSKSPQ